MTDPDHVIAAGLLREAFQHPVPRTDETEVVLRDLADYDTAFGVDIDLDIAPAVDLDVEVAS